MADRYHEQKTDFGIFRNEARRCAPRCVEVALTTLTDPKCQARLHGKVSLSLWRHFHYVLVLSWPLLAFISLVSPSPLLSALFRRFSRPADVGMKLGTPMFRHITIHPFRSLQGCSRDTADRTGFGNSCSKGVFHFRLFMVWCQVGKQGSTLFDRLKSDCGNNPANLAEVKAEDLSPPLGKIEARRIARLMAGEQGIIDHSSFIIERDRF